MSQEIRTKFREIAKARYNSSNAGSRLKIEDFEEVMTNAWNMAIEAVVTKDDTVCTLSLKIPTNITPREQALAWWYDLPISERLIHAEKYVGRKAILDDLISLYKWQIEEIWMNRSIQNPCRNFDKIN